MDYEKEILVQTLLLLEDWGRALVALDAGDHTQSWCRDYRGNAFAREYPTLGARYIPSKWAEWGRYALDAAGRQAFSRAARHLESLGLVVAVRQSGGRLTHLRLTPEGLRVAVQLAAADGISPNLDRLAQALAETQWANHEHLDVIEALAAQQSKESAT